MQAAAGDGGLQQPRQVDRKKSVFLFASVVDVCLFFLVPPLYTIRLYVSVC